MMDKHYQELFKLICQTAEVLAETAKEQNTTNKDEKGIESAEVMRADYARLKDTFSAADFDSTTLTRADYAKLMVGTYFVITQINARIEQEKKALTGYKIDVLPKLDRLINTKEDDEFNTLAADLFAKVEAAPKDDTATE